MLLTLLNGGGYRVLLQPSDYTAIAAEVVTQLESTAIPVNVKQVNDRQITGTGVPGDSMRPA